MRSLNRPDPALILRIVSEHRAGHTFLDIAARLRSEGLASPNGRPWYPETVRRIYREATRGGLT